MRVEDLCLAESQALQHVAVTELRRHNIGVSHGMLKGSNLRKKIERLSLRSNKRNIVSTESSGAVFGLSLQDVIQKEKMSTSSSNRSSVASQGNGNISMPTPPMPRRRINSSTSSELLKTQAQEAHATVHMSTHNNFRRNSLLIDALSLPVAQTEVDQRRISLEVSEPQVPMLVTKAMQFIESKAMMTEGIFRIPGAKNRINQIKKQVDAGVVQLSECQHPHDVACLLKEFFRCLPEPLLTRELYSAFLSTRRLESRSDRRDCLRLICMLLPQPNRDTLQQLLYFLDQVAMYSSEIILIDGTESTGNRMTEENLALIFGPNILHKRKPNDQSTPQRPQSHIQEELELVCKVTEDLIRMQRTLFTIPTELYDKVAGQLFLCDPEALDIVLRRHFTAARPRSYVDFHRVHSTDCSADVASFPQLHSSKSADVIDEGMNTRRKLWGTTSDLGLLKLTTHEKLDSQHRHHRFSSMGNDPVLNGPTALNTVGLRESVRLPCGSRDSAFSSCSVFDSRSSSEGFGMSSDLLQGSADNLNRTDSTNQNPVDYSSLGRKDKLFRNFRNASLPPDITAEDDTETERHSQDKDSSESDFIQSLDAIQNQLVDSFCEVNSPVEILVDSPPTAGTLYATSTPNHHSPDDGITIDNGLDMFAHSILSPELDAKCEELMSTHTVSYNASSSKNMRPVWSPYPPSPEDGHLQTCGISSGTSL
ncbi:rho GTPase-activating protein 6-like isoform X2 [Dysidea avara]